MKPTLIAAVLLVAVLLVAAPVPGSAQSAEWQIDPAHTAVQFAVKHLGISTVRGTFRKTSGTLRYEPANPAEASVVVVIDASSVDTRIEMRDNDLRSDHFFDVQKHPEITFKSTRIEMAGPGKLRVTGDLTLLGTTKQVTLDAEGPSKPLNDGYGHLRMGASATTTVDRTDFGMTGFQAVAGTVVTLTIDVEFLQPLAPVSH